jgi:hypothetical protein
MVSDGVGGYHGRTELGLLPAREGPCDVSACSVSGTGVLVSMLGRGVRVRVMVVVQPDGPRPLRR